MSPTLLDPAAGLWIDAARDCLREFARSALRVDAPIQFEDPIATMAESAAGGFVAMVGTTIRSQVGLVAGDAEQRELCRRFLHSEQDAEALNEEELVDAMGEAANVLAGQLKSALADVYPGLELGLPMYLRGQVAPAERQSLAVLPLRIGTTACELVFLFDRSSGRNMP